MPNRIRPRILLVIALAAACWLPGALLPARAQSPLEQQRQKQQAPAVRPPALTGRGVSLHNGLISTSIMLDWPSAGVSDGTVPRARLAARICDLRFLSPAHYSQVLIDPAARKGLDVDVACSIDLSASLVGVGPTGGMPEWLGVKFGAPIIVEKR